MGADIGRKYSGRRALFQPKQPPASLPEHWKETLVDGSHQIAGAERSTGAARRRTDDALDQLHVLDPPLRELLLVLEQRLGEKEQHRRAGSEIQVLERDACGVQQLEKEILQRGPGERRSHQRRNLAMLLDRPHEMLVA